MEGRKSPHPLSEAVAAEAGHYLTVIDHVLAMDYLKPELRRKVLRLQQQLIEAEINTHYPGENRAKTRA